MERSDSITLLELAHALADFIHYPAYIVALVLGRLVGHPFWSLPISTPVSVRGGRLGGMVPGTFQSLGLLPEYITFVTTCCGPGLGIGESMIWTLGPLATTASFMVDALRICLVVPEIRRMAEERTEVIAWR